MFKRTVVGLLAVILFSSVAIAQTQFTGKAGKAFYNILVPDVWNGSLVIWNHGYSFNPMLENPPDLGPLAPLQLVEGYAVAASSYRQSQWAVFKTTEDLQTLIEVFEEKVGTPVSVIVTGASLGGIVTADGLEQASLGNVVGAYTFCGALAGSRLWNGALDIRLTYDVICGDVPGAEIPGGPTGLPSQFHPFTPGDLGAALQACTGIFVPPAFRTLGEQSRLNQLLASTQLPENFILTDLFFSVFGIADLIFDQGKLHGRQGMGNMGVAYDDADVNATIERVKTHPGAANRLAENYTPDGTVGDVKIVSLHTDKDGLIIVENEKEYQDVVSPANLTVGIVVEAVPTHCGFTPAELVGGWEALRGWIATGFQPSPAVLQGTCAAVAAGGLFPGPCRIDPTFVIPDMDGRVKPR